MADRPVRWRRRVVIALVVLVVCGVVARALWTRRGVPSGSWVLLDLEGDYGEDVPPDSVARLFGEHPMSLLDLLLSQSRTAIEVRVAFGQSPASHQWPASSTAA